MTHQAVGIFVPSFKSDDKQLAERTSKPRMTLAAHSERSEPQRGDDLAALLDRTVDCLTVISPATAPALRRLRDLRQRLQEQRLQLAVLGQFKRGKSTVLNALLGEPLLPTGVIPLTAIPTFIAWGPMPLIRVTYQTNRVPDEFKDSAPDRIRDRLFGFVAEEGNPKNCLGVARVDLFYPAAILKHGVVLIDTPGIASTHRHNTDAALQILPECDAALFVVSADPPITEPELAYLEMVRPNVARLFFVLNKADYLEPQDLRVAAEFLRKTVRQEPRAEPPPTVFCASALAGLRAKKTNDATALEKSGLSDIERFLLTYLAQEKVVSLRDAVRRKTSDLLVEVEADLSLRVRTLEMPIEDLEKRSVILDESLARIEDEKRVVRDLLAGDRRRAVEQLETYAERLRQRGRQYLGGVLDRALSRSDQENAESAAQEAAAAAIPDFFEQELTETSREFSGAVEQILAGHQRRTDDLVNLVRRTAAELFEVPYIASTESERFKLGQEPYWITQRWSDRLVSIPSGLVNRLLPANVRRARIRAQLQEQVNELVQRNVENLRWATLQGLDGTFRSFATALDERLAEALEVTIGAVKAASAERRTASDRADAELATLRRTSSILAQIRAALARLSIHATSPFGQSS